MTLPEIARMRLFSQQITGEGLATAKDVVSHLGAMQAQDYAMAKWAIGLRMKSGSEKAVDAAIDKGEILRTHVLRPTWHFVSAKDIYWMLELTGPRIRTSMRSRHKELGLSDAILKKSNRIFEKALAKGDHLTREELLAGLQAAKIDTGENRAAHLLFSAELEGLLCSGAGKGNKRTYALLAQRVPKKQTLPKDEALARLAGIYFNSRGPATLADFTWWSGLSPADARRALEIVKPGLMSESPDVHTYWFKDPLAATKKAKANVQLLPAFDELILSYKDRTATVHLSHQKKAFSSNGIFWPTVLVNGQVSGLWKRSLLKDRVLIEPGLFGPLSPTLKAKISACAEEFGHFLGKKAELLYP